MFDMGPGKGALGVHTCLLYVEECSNRDTLPLDISLHHGLKPTLTQLEAEIRHLDGTLRRVAFLNRIAVVHLSDASRRVSTLVFRFLRDISQVAMPSSLLTARHVGRAPRETHARAADTSLWGL